MYQEINNNGEVKMSSKLFLRFFFWGGGAWGALFGDPQTNNWSVFIFWIWPSQIIFLNLFLFFILMEILPDTAFVIA